MKKPTPHIPFTHAHWLSHVKRSLLTALLLVSVSLALGIAGYHYIGGLGWVDATLEASMILGGMGAIAPMHDDATKLFASFYALFSGFAVLSTTGLLIAPWLHRLIYRSHRQAHHDARQEEKTG